MHAAQVREAARSDFAPEPSAALPGAQTTISSLVQVQAAPPAPAPVPPAIPVTPGMQGMPPEARRAISEAIREAQQAAAQAREEARQAQEQVRVTVGDEVVTVGGGTGQGGAVGRPGGTIIYPGPPPGPLDHVPPQVFDLVLAFFFMIAFITVGTAVARAFGRRAENRPVQVGASPELSAQLQRIEHAVEAMAIEVERISEAQRYMARLESERGGDPALLARPGRRD